MKKKILPKIGMLVLIIVVALCSNSAAFNISTSTRVASSKLSKTDLKRYFEKAMQLFEAGKYEEAISVFKNLIELEKNQKEFYFTPFAEIYIDKAASRIREINVLDEKKWKNMKQAVISETERIAREREEGAQKSEGERLELLYEEEMKKKLKETELKKKEYELEQKKKALQERESKKKLQEAVKKKMTLEFEKKIKDTYAQALGYYKEKRYPEAIVELKKIKTLDPNNRLVPKVNSYIDKAQKALKRAEEKALLVKMEAARRAKLEMELEMEREERDKERKEKEKQIVWAKEERLKKIEEEKERIQKRRMERQKLKLREAFEKRLKAQMLSDRIAKIEGLMSRIRLLVRSESFKKAKKLVEEAMLEFPENTRFKDILHHVEMQEVRKEEKALARARDLVEEKMLIEVAKKHMLPEEKFGVLEKEEKAMRLVKVPEIRKRLRIPISFDFKEVELDYVLDFLSDATGVNIVPSSEIDMAESKVTIKIKNMPLEEALKYILKTQELIYRIEEDAVWVATKEELDNEQLETRVYFLNQGIGRFAEYSGIVDTESGSSTASTEVKTIQTVLENAVEWPKEAKLTLDERTGALIINNTPSNLEIVENLLYNLDITPLQILIEARFLEVKVTNVDELGIEWKFNSDWGFKQNNAKQNLHGIASNSGVDFSAFSRVAEGFNLTYQGILSHPQFQMVMHALKERQNVKTLSAPRITTLNNQTATIEVIDEHIYPTRYEVSLVQYDINGDGDFDDAGETEWANIPQDFVTRDVGILLHVKPSVGVDEKTITLALSPEVSETSTSFTYSGDVSIPQFQTRNLSTSVIVSSGDTVVLGGLIKESSTNIETKVPVLGDIPFIGALFRKNTDTTERRNLLIFVTASVLNQEDSLVARLDEEQGI